MANPWCAHEMGTPESQSTRISRLLFCRCFRHLVQKLGWLSHGYPRIYVQYSRFFLGGLGPCKAWFLGGDITSGVTGEINGCSKKDSCTNKRTVYIFPRPRPFIWLSNFSHKRSVFGGFLGGSNFKPNWRIQVHTVDGRKSCTS